MRDILPFLIAFTSISSIALAQQGSVKWQDAIPPTPIVLNESWSKALDMPSFQYGELAQCDADGNLYFHATTHINDSVILKLKSDGSYALHTLPPDDAAKTYFEAFRAGRDGVLRILTHANSTDELYLYEFKSENNDPTSTRLDVPAGLLPLNFQVLQKGEIAIHGYVDDKAPEHQGKSYLGIFDAGGRVLKESFNDSSEGLAKDAHDWMSSAATAEAEDGSNYMLSGSDVLVLSGRGDAIRTIHLDPPARGYRPVNIFVAGGWMLVAFFKVPDKGEGRGGFLAMYQTFDRHTGENLKIYKPAPELGNNLVCFTKYGFTFLTVEKRHLKLVGAKP